MDVAQITAALDQVFNDEQVRIVFWNDPDGEFAGSLPDIALEGVEVLKLDEVGALEAKVRIEQDDPAGRYLLYSPAEEPDYENDWLLDMRLYSRSFRADRSSIILQELGLVHQYLRQHLAKRRKFFDNKERLHKLTSFVSPEDSELDLDRKMLAVVAKADQPELFNIVRTLFHSMTEGDAPDLEAAPLAWAQIERFELDEPFWAMVKSAFGYDEDSPTCRIYLSGCWCRITLTILRRNYPVRCSTSNCHVPALRMPWSAWPNGETAAARVAATTCWRMRSGRACIYRIICTVVRSRLFLMCRLFLMWRKVLCRDCWTV